MSSMGTLTGSGLASLGALEPFLSKTKRLPGTGTGYLYDPRFLDHPHSTERPERLAAIENMMLSSGLLAQVVSIAPSDIFNVKDAVLLVHTPAHYAGVSRIPLTGPVAGLAAAGALAAVDAVCKGEIKNAFCAIRPPGHHAHNSGGEEGFCFYGNAAIATKYAQQTYPYLIKRVLIIDWDYHHGNGTQDFFYSDPTVLFFSTHDWHAYPGTGDPALKGEGAGYGFNINVHMAAGSSDSDFVKAWNEQLLPAAASFKPDLVIISAGFDSKQNDSLGTFTLTPAGYGALTTMAMQIASTHCCGRLISLLEGGYADADDGGFDGIAISAKGHIEALIATSGDQSCLLSNRKVPARKPFTVNKDVITLQKTDVRITGAWIVDGCGRTLLKASGEMLGSGKITCKVGWRSSYLILHRQDLSPLIYPIDIR